MTFVAARFRGSAVYQGPVATSARAGRVPASTRCANDGDPPGPSPRRTGDPDATRPRASPGPGWSAGSPGRCTTSVPRARCARSTVRHRRWTPRVPREGGPHPGSVLDAGPRRAVCGNVVPSFHYGLTGTCQNCVVTTPTARSSWSVSTAARHLSNSVHGWEIPRPTTSPTCSAPPSPSLRR